MAAALRPIASTMRFAHLTELSLAPCVARRLWPRTRSSSIPRHYHGFQRRLHCRTRLDERFSDLFLLLSEVELVRNGARLKSACKRTWPRKLAGDCLGASSLATQVSSFARYLGEARRTDVRVLAHRVKWSDDGDAESMGPLAVEL